MNVTKTGPGIGLKTHELLMSFLRYLYSRYIHPCNRLLRMVAVGFQCDAGSKSCLGNMTAMFRKWTNDPLTNR